MAPPNNKEVVELYVENEKTGQWRTVVVCCDTVLFQLHRIIQYAFMKKVISDSALETASFAFTFRGSPVKAAKTTGIHRILQSDDFLNGKEPLKYVACGNSYTVAARKRSVKKVEVSSYVPRLVDASEEEALDKVNKKFLFTKFLNNPKRNREGKKRPPAVFAPPHVDLLAYHLGLMRSSVGSEL